MDYWDPLLIVLILLVPMFYLATPVGIMFQQKLLVHPALRELDLQELKPDLAKFLMAKTKDLFELGFDEPTLIRIPDPAPYVTVYLVLLVNRATGDSALVTAVVGQWSVIRLKSYYVEFSTLYNDERSADTFNGDELPAYPPGAGVVRTQVPAVTDTRELYDLHRYLLKEQGFPGKPVLYEKGFSQEYLIHYGFERPYAEAARMGWLRYDPSGDCYRPTFKGAYLMTWGLMPPFKQLRMRALRAKERQLLDEFRKQRA